MSKRQYLETDAKLSAFTLCDNKIRFHIPAIKMIGQLIDGHSI